MFLYIIWTSLKRRFKSIQCPRYLITTLANWRKCGGSTNSRCRSKCWSGCSGHLSVKLTRGRRGRISLDHGKHGRGWCRWDCLAGTIGVNRNASSGEGCVFWNRDGGGREGILGNVHRWRRCGLLRGFVTHVDVFTAAIHETSYGDIYIAALSSRGV